MYSSTIDASAPSSTSTPAWPLAWQPGFAALGPVFFTPTQPTPLPNPQWIAYSPALAQQLDLPVGADGWPAPAALQVLTGNSLPSASKPLASVYSGHQFGVWAGQLGDGRAILLGTIDTADGPLELQLKGSGPTRYSRGGDGRAVLRSSIREFLCSEAMHALGIPTTRALSVTASPQPVYRETVESAAVVARVAPSFIRFGHFEHFASCQQWEPLRQLADWVIDQYYPACRHSSAFGGNPYAALLQAVSERSAALVAQWQAVGFCHGVLNTDNMSILGLTLDYGPFQFLDAFVPGHICNHSDTRGRYAFERQPHIVYWNLYCLGQALQPLIGDPAIANAALASYKTVFPAALMARMCAKLGLRHDAPEHVALVDGVLQLLAQEGIDYTIFWRRLAQAVAQGDTAPVFDLFADRTSFAAWLATYLAQTPDASLMYANNPRYVLRNHLGQQAIQAAQQGDLSVLHTLQTLLERPFDEHPGHEAQADFPPDWASSIAISCSS